MRVNLMRTRIFAGAILACLSVSGLAFAQPAFTKAQVGDQHQRFGTLLQLDTARSVIMRFEVVRGTRL